MVYHLSEQHGDTVAVPQLVFSNLTRADGDTVRVALYILSTGNCDPRALAHALGLKSLAAAQRALQYWHGVGLLDAERGTSLPQQAPEQRLSQLDLAAAMEDPMVTTLTEEAQQNLGRALGHADMLKLVSLYQQEGYPVDVILLCTVYKAKQGKNTVAAVQHELARWRADGVETGEDAERYLVRESSRRTHETEAAEVFGRPADQLTMAEKRTVARWYEDWHYSGPMIREAKLRAGSKDTMRYVDGILRSWHSQGFTSLNDVRGGGTLQGSNITGTAAAGKAPSSQIQDIFSQNWGTLFDNGSTEG